MVSNKPPQITYRHLRDILGIVRHFEQVQTSVLKVLACPVQVLIDLW